MLTEQLTEFASSEPVKKYPLYIPEVSHDIGGGYRAGTFNVFVADSGLGKSWFMIQQAIHLAKHKIKTLLFSTEMQAQDVLPRCFASLLQISVGNTYRDEEGNNLGYIGQGITAMLELEEYLEIVYEKDIETIIETTEAAYEDRGVNVVLIDHIHFLASREPEKSRNEYQFERYTQSLLEKLWNQYNICVIVAAQPRKSDISNLYQAHGNKENIRGSSAWYQLASTVLYLFETSEQKEMNAEVVPPKRKGVTLNIAKGRHAIKSSSYLLEYASSFGRLYYLEHIIFNNKK